MKYKSIIFKITLSGLLMALAIVLSFATFRIGVGNVYLVGIAIFTMPLILKPHYAILTGVASVVIADALNGWVAFTWISVLAYGAALIIICIFKLLRFKWIYILGLIVASSIVVLIYFLLEWITFDKSFATTDAISTAIQFCIVVPVVSMLYRPLTYIINFAK